MVESIDRTPDTKKASERSDATPLEVLKHSDNNDDFIERLRRVVEKMGSASALARQAGISGSGFQKYLGGAEPTRKVLLALAEAAHIDLQWLMTGSGSMETTDRGSWPENHLTLLPLFRDGEQQDLINGDKHDTPKDNPERLVQLAFCREWLGKHGFNPAHLATLRVTGDSMEPTLRSGDTLVVDCNELSIADGEIYVIRDASHLLIKRLQRQLGGRVKLISDNTRYPAIEADTQQLNILGKVIWRGALL